MKTMKPEGCKKIKIDLMRDFTNQISPCEPKKENGKVVRPQCEHFDKCAKGLACRDFYDFVSLHLYRESTRRHPNRMRYEKIFEEE